MDSNHDQQNQNLLCSHYTIAQCSYWEPYMLTLKAHTNNINTSAARQKAIGIHNGANTHHHDQSITLHSFNTIKTMANKPQKLMPPPAEELVELLIKIYLSLMNYIIGN